MEPLPDDVEAAVADAVGAYVRATPRQRLPGPLRRFHGMRPKALMAWRSKLLDALDDDDFRSKVVDWLDDDPPLDKSRQRLLRLAAERPDGWEGKLRAASVQGSSAPDRDLGAALERARAAIESERRRASRARDEARRARDAARSAQERAARAIEAERRRADALAHDVEELEERLIEARAEAVRAGDAASGAALERDRLARRERRARDEAAADARAARKALAAERRELERLRQEVQLRDEKLRSRERPSKGGPGSDMRSPERRKPLPVPKGRLVDDPETLREWLSQSGVVLLVDGYNVARAEGGFGHLDLERQRDHLVQSLRRLATRFNLSDVIVVFDGLQMPAGTSRLSRPPVTVEYSVGEVGEIADDRLLRDLEELPNVPAVVVTNDRELQDRARRRGATIATSDQLLKVIRPAAAR